MQRRGLAVALAILAWSTFAMAQQAAPGKDSSGSAAASKTKMGKDLYVQYCAACHGESGKGDGPVAPALKMKPADLTTLAARNGGKFPEMRVTSAIKSGPGVPAHGTETMPVWGPIFLEDRQPASEREADLKIFNLMEYIRTLQAK